MEEKPVQYGKTGVISVEIHVETEKCVENIIPNILKADKPISSFEQIIFAYI